VLAIFLETLPFFLIVGLGYFAGRIGFFTPEATAYLTKFVFFFALSAMLFRFAANLQFSDVFDPDFLLAYLVATVAVYLIATAVAVIRRVSVPEAAFEAQCAVIGNIGFLGLPMLAVLMGDRAILGIMQMMVVDLLVFSSLVVILVTGSREGRVRLRTLSVVGLGVLKNPMIVSTVLGFTWSAAGWAIPAPMENFLTILGAAATPGALFAIGASLAGKSAARLSVASWIAGLKLVVHPAACAITALILWPVQPHMAAVMIAAAALPVAGNVYMLASHYGVAPQRVSTAILVTTALSVITLPIVLGLVAGL
jgi:malonate transporter and related proteins